MWPKGHLRMFCKLIERRSQQLRDPKARHEIGARIVVVARVGASRSVQGK